MLTIVQRLVSLSKGILLGGPWRDAKGDDELALHIADRQVAELAKAIKRTRIPIFFFAGICLFAALRWPDGHWIVATCLVIFAITIGGIFVLPRMGNSLVRYRTVSREKLAFTVQSLLASATWAFLFSQMISAAPQGEKIGWITINIALLAIGTATFALMPIASGLYCFNLAAVLWLTIWFEDLTMPLATKLLLPLFAAMIHHANMRTFGQFRSHIVADWTLRRHQKAREADAAEASRRDAQEMAEARGREEARARAAREQEEQQRRVLAEQRRRGMLEIADQYERSVAAHTVDLEQVVGSLVGAIERINNAGTAVRSSAESMLGLAADSTDATQAVAHSTDRLSVAAEDISAQVQQQREAAAASDEAGEAAQATLTALTQETERIGEIVELIQSLATQTNLLALNAAIEASRAGDAGRGFAVVAGEVKQLASQTHGAIGRIGEIVEATRTRMREMQDSISAIARSVDEASDRASHIVGAVDNQRQATRTIGQAAESTAGIAGRLRHVAERVVTDIGTTDKHTREIEDAIQALRARSHALSETSDTFLSQLRSASG